MYTAVFKMDNQQGSTVKHVELCSVLGGRTDGREVLGGVDTCTCMVSAFAVCLKLAQHC